MEQLLAGSPTSAFLWNSHLQAVRQVLSHGTATCRQSDKCFLMEQLLAGSPTSAFLWNSHLQAVRRVLSYGTATCRQSNECFLIQHLYSYYDSLRARRPGDRIPVTARFSAPVRTDPGAHPASYKIGTGFLSRR